MQAVQQLLGGIAGRKLQANGLKLSANGRKLQQQLQFPQLQFPPSCVQLRDLDQCDAAFMFPQVMGFWI